MNNSYNKNRLIDDTNIKIKLVNKTALKVKNKIEETDSKVVDEGPL